MAFEVTQVTNDATARRAVVVADEMFAIPANLDIPHLKLLSNSSIAVFDQDNPFQIITSKDRSPDVGPVQRSNDPLQLKELPKAVVTELEKLAAEFAETGKFISDEQLKGVLNGTINEKDLLINRLRTTIKKAVGDGKDIGPVVDAINKKLASLKSPYEIKAAEYKSDDGTFGFNIKLVDRNTGKEKDKFLVITWDESQIEKLAKHFSEGKFLSPDELDKTTGGKMHIKDTRLGELMTTIQDAVTRGIDPQKIVDSLNAHLTKSKSKFKIEAEKDGDSIRLNLVDRDTGKSSGKIRVPFEPLW